MDGRIKRLWCWSLSVFVLWSLTPGKAHAEISITEAQKDNQPVFIIENDYYKTILAHTRARLPLSYVFKATGHEQFDVTVPLSEPADTFRYYGGILDSIPWVSGPGLPPKGYLWSSKWDVTTRRGKDYVFFKGRTQFEYKDPSTGKPCALSFAKTITGYDDSSRLKMDYRIENIGNVNAKYELSVHTWPRSGGKADDGDYFYAPGNSCEVYYGSWPGVMRTNAEPPYWTYWPIEEAINLKMQKEPRHIFVFLPSNWAVVGDDKFKESLFFVSSPIINAERVHQMKMGNFMTHEDLALEACLTYRIGAESWDEPEATLMLKPGESCHFTLDMVAYQGIELARIRTLSEQDVISNCLILRKPNMTVEGETASISAELALPGKAIIRVVELIGNEDKELQRKDAGPGTVTIKHSFPKKPGVYALKLTDLSGTTQLYKTIIKEQKEVKK